MAVEQACKNSSWKDEEECVIQVQFPFQVEDKRKYAISGKWYIFCFTQKVQKKENEIIKKQQKNI